MNDASNFRTLSALLVVATSTLSCGGYDENEEHIVPVQRVSLSSSPTYLRAMLTEIVRSTDGSEITDLPAAFQQAYGFELRELRYHFPSLEIRLESDLTQPDPAAITWSAFTISDEVILPGDTNSSESLPLTFKIMSSVPVECGSQPQDPTCSLFKAMLPDYAAKMSRAISDEFKRGLYVELSGVEPASGSQVAIRLLPTNVSIDCQLVEAGIGETVQTAERQKLPSLYDANRSSDPTACKETRSSPKEEGGVVRDFDCKQYSDKIYSFDDTAIRCSFTKVSFPLTGSN